jgi:hypothetical protein
MNRKVQNRWRIGSLIVFLAIVALGVFSNRDKCWNRLVIKQSKFHGVVTKLYLDELNHNDFTLELDRGKRNVHLWLEDGGAFYELELGDSISKPWNSLKMDIWRDSKKLEVLLRYKCN